MLADRWSSGATLEEAATFIGLMERGAAMNGLEPYFY
jgi:hypothetical protein